MQEDYLISIKGVMEQDGETDSIELVTKGSFLCKNDRYSIIYEESEATGYEGCITIVRIVPNERVSMTRHGRASSHLIIERGMRHVCHYDTGVGTLNLGVSADFIESEFTSSGGSLRFGYFLDMDLRSISRNTVEITVRPSI